MTIYCAMYSTYILGSQIGSALTERVGQGDASVAVI